MASQLTLSIVTPERELVRVQADEVELPGTEGYFGVLPGHTPLLATLTVGRLTYRVGQERHVLAIATGLAEVLPDRVTVLSQIAELPDDIDVARHADLKIGVVPIINLEWIQKLHRDTRDRGYSKEQVADVVLRRMPDYIHYIVPQFSETDINFQRVPVVDTSNPFMARDIPTAGESMTVIRFKNPRGIDFPYLLSMIGESFMSRANTIVVPGGKMDLAMQLILTPMILRLMEIRRAQLH